MPHDVPELIRLAKSVVKETRKLVSEASELTLELHVNRMRTGYLARRMLAMQQSMEAEYGGDD